MIEIAEQDLLAIELAMRTRLLPPTKPYAVQRFSSNAAYLRVFYDNHYDERHIILLARLTLVGLLDINR